MQDVNVMTLVCRLARDPELRSLPNGPAVCELRVAYNTSKKSPSGEWEDKGNFVNVTVWGAQGEAVARNLTKGQRIGVVGRLEHRTWQDKEGGNREAHGIVAQTVQYLTPKSEVSSAPQQTASTPPPADDDDIPF